MKNYLNGRGNYSLYFLCDRILLRLKEPPYNSILHKVIHEIIHLLRGTWPPIGHLSV